MRRLLGSVVFIRIRLDHCHIRADGSVFILFFNYTIDIGGVCLDKTVITIIAAMAAQKLESIRLLF